MEIFGFHNNYPSFPPLPISLGMDFPLERRRRQWIAEAEAESKDQLDTLLKTDPFYTAGLRQAYHDEPVDR